MTAPLLTPRVEERTRVLAQEIAAAFRAKRIEKGDRQGDVAKYLGMRDYADICEFERKPRVNMMLGKAVRMLAVYGLTLKVVPIARGGQ